MKIAFYAPLKPPTHATPSGDRTMARSILSVLGDLGTVELASDLRSRDGIGDASVQDALLAQADGEIARLKHGAWDAWVTYHNYYKAPDLIGPAVTAALGIPYVIVEASRALKRLTGPWSRFAAIAESACDAADTILYMTAHDRAALERDRKGDQTLLHLIPFLDRDALPVAKQPVSTQRYLAVGMMREGDKLASYQTLAQAFEHVPGELHILGDGPAHAAVERLFHASARRVTFHGAVPPGKVSDHMRAASAMLWPGVNEAFGMVYLESQSVGLRCIAEDRPGVRDVVGPTGTLVPQNDPLAFAGAIRALKPETPATIAATRAAMIQHLRDGARSTLARALGIAP